MKRSSLFLIICLFVFTVARAQTEGTISGSFQDVKFIEFVNYIEEHSEYTLFYKYEWIKEISVTNEYNEAKISDVLADVLSIHDLNYYIDSDNNILLYPDEPIVSALNSITNASAENHESVKGETNLLDKNELSDDAAMYDYKSQFVLGQRKESSMNKQFIVGGQIISAETGSPIIGATIYIRETGKGAATDIDGYFKLVLSGGRYTARINSLTMKDREVRLEVYESGNIQIFLEEELQRINEVVISGNRINNVQGMQMGLEQISMKSIKEIPAVMGEKDLLKVAQMLAGVQSAGEGSAGILVRGGTADQNLFYINELPIYNTSHLFGFFSAFNPDIIRGYTLYKSHVPVNFGGRISSVFDINTRPGNKKELYGKGGISPVTGHFVLEGPIVKNKSSFMLSYRTTYSNWLLKQINNVNLQNSNASFYDISAAINTQVNDKNLIKTFFYNSSDKFSLSDFDDYDYENLGGVIYWKHLFSSSLTLDVSGKLSSYSFSHNSKSNPSEAYSQNYGLDHYEFKSELILQTLNDQRIALGISNIYYHLDRGNIFPYNKESTRIPIDFDAEKGLEQALFISDEFSLFSNLKIYAGLRYTLYSYLGPGDVNSYAPGLPKDINTVTDTKTFDQNEIIKQYHGPEPRILINYLINKNSSVKLSYNRTQQFIYMLSNTLAISPTDQWKLSDYFNSPVKADQVSTGYYHNFKSSPLEFSLELYTKRIQNVLEYKDGADFISEKPPEMYLLHGNQRVDGLEVMLRKNAGKLTGWLAYSYSNSKVRISDALIPENNINFGNEYPSNFDIPHSLNVVANFRTSRRISYAANFVYSTGRPVTYPVAVFYSGGNKMLHYSQRNEYRLPDYIRLDFSVTFDGNLLAKKWLHSTWMLNVYNLTGRKNAYSVFFKNENGSLQGYKMSIFGRPVVTLSWNFKFGNYVSE